MRASTEQVDIKLTGGLRKNQAQTEQPQTNSRASSRREGHQKCWVKNLRHNIYITFTFCFPSPFRNSSACRQQCAHNDLHARVRRKHQKTPTMVRECMYGQTMSQNMRRFTRHCSKVVAVYVRVCMHSCRLLMWCVRLWVCTAFYLSKVLKFLSFSSLLK